MKRICTPYIIPETEYSESMLAAQIICVSGDGDIDDVTGDDWGNL